MRYTPSARRAVACLIWISFNYHARAAQGRRALWGNASTYLEHAAAPPTRALARFRPRPLSPTLCSESHTSDRWPFPFGPKLGLQHLLWRPWARLGEGRARLLGRIKGHEPGMRITLRHARCHRGAEPRVGVGR